MKLIYKIALTELKTLFYSPVAWLILIIFTIQTGVDYIAILDVFQRNFAKGARIPGMTARIFTGEYGLFTHIQSKMFLYLPLLSMGLLSRELSSGSIKLLLSSPITIGEIVWGKFLAILFCGFLFIIILSGFVFVTSIIVPEADIKLMISGLIGVFLMIAVYSSIGLFMSSLTIYQPIAALSTFVILGVLNYTDFVWQDNAVIRYISSFLSINSRTEQIIEGLITTKQVGYFCIMSGLFISMTIVKLRLDQRSRSPEVRMSRYGTLVLFAFFLEYIASKPSLTGYLDMTATKSQTLAPESQNTLAHLKLPLLVHTYVNMLDDDHFLQLGLPKARNQDINFFDPYQRFLKDEIRIDYTYYFDSVPSDNNLYRNNKGRSLKILAENIADNNKFDASQMLDSDAIRKKIDLRPRKNQYTRQFQVGNNTSMVGFFEDTRMVPGEKEMMDALKLLTTAKTEIGFLVGHNERTAEDGGIKDRDYNIRMNTLTVRRSMVNHGFHFRKISVDTAQIPNDISLLIIADPMIAIRENELAKVQNYIARGRSLLIFSSPDHRNLLNPVINPLGVRFMDGRLLTVSDPFTPTFLIAHFDSQTANYSKALKGLYDDSAVLATPAASALQYDTGGPFLIKPFLVTDKNKVWIRQRDKDSGTTQIVFDSASGDRFVAYPIAVTLERQISGKDQRIMIFGDADMLSDGQAYGGIPKKNADMTAEIFKWFNHGEFPADIYYPTLRDESVHISNRIQNILNAIFIFIVPICLFVSGSIILISRRNK